MKTIDNRADVEVLVYSFYAKIRKDDLLGPIFNKHIPEKNWPGHLDKLSDFWESQLFGISKFRGNPTMAHKNVDQAHHHKINEDHFNHWLNIWFETIDELFEGERALRAKNSAHRMAGAQFMMMVQMRPK